MSEIVFQAEEDLMDGGWVATALGAGITTQAESLDELKAMIRDALKCHFGRETDIQPVLRWRLENDFPCHTRKGRG
ncbi:2-oxoisovalerate dehydrogenase [Candidatus Sumerlaeota bacterium]|nr:2-oxoisovalerate dehydrogenase [Candidatus Sumerlaeota bacterium]